MDPATAIAVGAVLIAFGGQFFTARFSSRSQDRATRVEERVAAVEGYDRLTVRLEARIAALEKELAAVHAELRAANSRIAELLGASGVLKEAVMRQIGGTDEPH